MDSCKSFNIQELAMPRIGSGLDNLDWSIVSRIIDDVFEKYGNSCQFNLKKKRLKAKVEKNK